ncbi:MAG: VCBS repeat-containing protein, partial [Saprospiraceae bacterium]|nr:VCBS repeat-containing protein [Saprospiraceae bacterium]
MRRAAVGNAHFGWRPGQYSSSDLPLLFCLFALAALSACRQEPKLFRLLDSAQTGVAFNNSITETDSINILTAEFVYNGGGVAIGDLNGDGLPDLYFTGNQVPNKLYLNRGQLRFEDVTDKARAQKKPGQWSSGISIVDINCDGKADIYVCNTFVQDPEKRRNLLFVNQGNAADGIPQFEEMAHAYGIDDTTHSSNAQFFDYDNDGDLDLFIGTNFMDKYNPNQYVKKIADGSAINRDRLYRNDPDPASGHPFFTEVTQEAGLIWDGYSHSALIADFNDDGWPDIYVANDYVSNDLIYINNGLSYPPSPQGEGRGGVPPSPQGEGRGGVPPAPRQVVTFTNHAAQLFKHQSASAMGSDVADVNNDGKPDLFTTEMLPYYNKRKKLFLSGNSYATYINNADYGY